MSEKIPQREKGENALLKMLSVWAALHAADGAHAPLRAVEIPRNTTWVEVIDKLLHANTKEKFESMAHGVLLNSGEVVWTYRQTGTRIDVPFDPKTAANTVEGVKGTPEAICIVHNHLLNKWGDSLPPSSTDAQTAFSYSSVAYRGKNMPMLNAVVDSVGVWNFHKLTEQEAKKHFPRLSLKISELKVDGVVIEEARQKWFALSPKNTPRDIDADKKVAAEYARLREVFARNGVFIENVSIEDAQKGGPCGWKPSK